MDQARETLQALIDEKGVPYTDLSRLLGRNQAYITQFFRRGSPRRLPEQDRAILAKFFDVDESRLGGPVRALADNGMIPVPRLAVKASAGPGAATGSEISKPPMAFDRQWLRSVAKGSPDQLSLIKVQGDSMEPTLRDGDEILVDRGDAAPPYRDGIYVIRADDVLLVKRLSLSANSGRILIRSDNPAYPAQQECDGASLVFVGRVVWAGRRMS